MLKTDSERPSTTKSHNNPSSDRHEKPTIEHDIFVDEEGNLHFIYDDELAGLLECGEPTRTRASHVEPFGSSEWTADMSLVGVPLLGPFPTRAEALRQEKLWLNQHLDQ